MKTQTLEVIIEPKLDKKAVKKVKRQIKDLRGKKLKARRHALLVATAYLDTFIVRDTPLADIRISPSFGTGHTWSAAEQRLDLAIRAAEFLLDS